nr:hypothetical protein [Paraburkholderia nemoris]
MSAQSSESSHQFKRSGSGDVSFEHVRKDGQCGICIFVRLSGCHLAFGNCQPAHKLTHSPHSFVSASSAEAAKERDLRKPRTVLDEIGANRRGHRTGPDRRAYYDQVVRRDIASGWNDFNGTPHDDVSQRAQISTHPFAIAEIANLFEIRCQHFRHCLREQPCGAGAREIDNKDFRLGHFNLLTTVVAHSRAAIAVHVGSIGVDESVLMIHVNRRTRPSARPVVV